jgi:hypothetical protein
MRAVRGGLLRQSVRAWAMRSMRQVDSVYADVKTADSVAAIRPLGPTLTMRPKPSPPPRRPCPTSVTSAKVVKHGR